MFTGKSHCQKYFRLKVKVNLLLEETTVPLTMTINVTKLFAVIFKHYNCILQLKNATIPFSCFDIHLPPDHCTEKNQNASKLLYFAQVDVLIGRCCELVDPFSGHICSMGSYGLDNS